MLPLCTAYHSSDRGWAPPLALVSVSAAPEGRGLPAAGTLQEINNVRSKVFFRIGLTEFDDESGSSDSVTNYLIGYVN